jgi:hypothetical protein
MGFVVVVAWSRVALLHFTDPAHSRAHYVSKTVVRKL